MVAALIKGKISTGVRITGNINGLGNVSGQIGKAQSVYVRELDFKNRMEFPNIGKENMIYVALDEHAAYIFDGEQNVYHCIVRNYREIGAIQCGLRED